MLLNLDFIVTAWIIGRNEVGFEGREKMISLQNRSKSQFILELIENHSKLVLQVILTSFLNAALFPKLVGD